MFEPKISDESNFEPILPLHSEAWVEKWRLAKKLTCPEF